DVALVPFRLQPRDLGELGGADRCVILGMADQDAPGIAEPIVKPDLPGRAVLLEVRGDLPELYRHGLPPRVAVGADMRSSPQIAKVMGSAAGRRSPAAAARRSRSSSDSSCS